MKRLKMNNTCLALLLASSVTLSGCGSSEVSIFNNAKRSSSTSVQVNGDNNNVVVNGDNVVVENSSVTVNGVTITENGDSLNIHVGDESHNVKATSYNLDNVEIEIKKNETEDGNLVFIKNIYNYIEEDGNVEYGIILDRPKNKSLRKTLVYSYTYKIIDADNAVYAIYEVDDDGNEILLETHIVDRDKKLGLFK